MNSKDKNKAKVVSTNMDTWLVAAEELFCCPKCHGHLNIAFHEKNKS